MKKYLLTWYGITDLRAGLGLEKSTGPVLGALLAEDYTNVIILGYTKNEETTSKDETYKKLINLSDNTNSKDTWALINDYANTKDAHLMFKKWLSSKLHENNKSTEVNLYPVVLDKLNDTEKIYTAAIECLDMIATNEKEKEVTLYLSPGTPVMAFSWAFAALQNPALKVRVIASSNMFSPPETVSIPYNLLQWKGIEVPSSHPESHISNDFDTIFHLFGGQRMPSLFGIIQFNTKRHIFINSQQYPASAMKEFLGKSKFDEIHINPFDPKNVEMKILQYLDKNPANGQIGFNLTGGTKLMYAGAMSASKKVNGVPFYFETKNNTMLFLDDFSSVSTKSIDNVETFIKVNTNDLNISDTGKWGNDSRRSDPKRALLTQHLWNAKNILSNFYRELSAYDPGVPFDTKRQGVHISLSRRNSASITIDNKTFDFDNWSDFAKYLSGGWFEEFTYTLLKPLMNEGIIKDLRIGLEVNFKEQQKSTTKLGLGKKSMPAKTYQELDVMFTDGKRLYIIECKAGMPRSEHVPKLQEIIKYFGGNEGRGILVTVLPPNYAAVKKRIKESSLWAVSGQDLPKQLTALITKLIKNK